ncbi:MAG: radical SAM protein [Deltaproteobacteria bacterium]|nr:radical SAM protein [Deltaproteobacteria bacterium]
MTPRSLRPDDLRLGFSFAQAALFDPYRPLMANLVVIRRCNLSCSYCTEYDSVSPPVAFDTLQKRVGHLARLRTLVVTLTGGEPLLHPDLARVVRSVRDFGMTPAMNTNGFLLTREWIDALNDAGLYAMQVSVDGVLPNADSVKSLKTLEPKLRLLADHARFRVRVNTVLGAAPADEALAVVRAVTAMGLEAKCSLKRLPDGTLAPLDEHTRTVYEQISRVGGRQPGVFDESFQDAMLAGRAREWKCRAGARFFHVDEEGRVDLCAPKRGSPGRPLDEYDEDDLERAFHARKACEARCPVAYAHQLSRVDMLRTQRGATFPGTRSLAVLP